jgi:hypothetical protein
MAKATIGELRALGGKGFEPLPAGPYAVEVTNAEFVAKPDKNPYFKTEFTITEGPSKGRKFWDNITLAQSEGSAGVFFGKMRNLGLGEDFWDPWQAKDLDESAPYVCQALIGRPAVVVVYIDDSYQGRIQNKIRSIQAPKAGVPTPTGAAYIPAEPLQVTTAPRAFTGPTSTPVVPNLPPGL